MSIELYDAALLKKLQGWTRDTHISITGVDESTRLFSSILDQQNDTPIKLPLIALSRPGGYTITSRYKQPKTFSGLPIARTNNRSAILNAVPVDIPYQLDIYARYLQEADEYARNLVFNIINYPKFLIEIPYEDLGFKHTANIHLTSDVENNSDIPEKLFTGQFVRFTIKFNITDAYLFDVRIKDNVSIVSADASF